MASFIRSDLEFILKQIQIAERNAAGEPLYSLLPNVQVPWGLRTISGAYNNLVFFQSQYGAADNIFPRMLEPVFRSGELVGFDPDGPGPQQVGDSTSYAQTHGAVFDSQPRLISNLIADQTANNLAAVVANGGNAPVVSPGLDGLFGTGDERDVFFIQNVTPDAGLTAPFNSWMTFFGQFFDHGLDLVSKGGNGTIFIPLNADDPLVAGADGIFGNADDLAPQLRFMALTRATMLPGDDGILGTDDDIHENTNTTSPFVDQNQTYSSHPSHQVFLRAYALDAGGQPHSTGKLITNKDLGADHAFGGTGANADTEIGGMATWEVVKAQARDLLGINLTDHDFNNVPLLLTDEYGRFIPGAARGMPQLIVGLGADGKLGTADDVLVEGNRAAPVDPTAVAAFRTGHAFLNDIAHNATPVSDQTGAFLTPDADNVINTGPMAPGQYDDELLNAHYIAGDGRVNENIGLTAVHSIFHSEHNRLVDQSKATLIADAADMLAKGHTQAESVAFLNEWLLTDVTTVPASANGLNWDGERLFQAAKFGTEMQYQHLVFEEFARTVQPNVDAFLAPAGYDVTIDPSIVAEFAHTVYRFGHSMLTETIDRLDPNFNSSEIGLIEAFLNPLAFKASGVTPDQAVGAIVRGVTRQAGNEIDEFVTEAVRNNLLGLPLDLPAINIARARDAGIPSLNAARQTFYAATGDEQLRPYKSWADLVQYLKHPESVINFIAAYGAHDSVTSETTLAGKRAAAALLVLGGAGEPSDRLDFLNSTGLWANNSAIHPDKDLDGVTTTGLGDIDFWIGGLAEEQMPFGGLLGSTFNFVFETQLEALQNADRFYYLSRTAGLQFGTQLEMNSFAKLVMLNSDATHLPAHIFQTPTWVLEVDPTKQFNGAVGNADPTGGIFIDGIEVVALVSRDNPLTAGPDTNFLRYTGEDHVVMGGTAGDDIIISGDGDDTLYGDGGNDRLEGGYGNDNIQGGDGNDIIQDSHGDDILDGGAGNDVIHAGNMSTAAIGNIVFGGDGNDFVITTEDITTTFGGKGDDFILGAKTNLPPTGNEGDDWIEFGTQDGAPGDNFDPNLNDPILGNDIFVGGGGFDEMIGEGGDDIFVGSDAQDKMDGMSGFDWVTYKNDKFGVTVDLTLAALAQPHGNTIGDNIGPIGFVGFSPDSILDRFAEVEGVSGSKYADILKGGIEDAVTIVNHGGATGGALTNVALINGLQGILGAGATGFATGNIMLGGAGSDFIEGRQGDDLIDGDAWLNVRISVRQAASGPGHDIEIRSVDSMQELVADMLAGLYDPGQLVAVREIKDDNNDFDTAVFTGDMADYTILDQGGGVFTVEDSVVGRDGIDTLRNIERLQFADQNVRLSPTGNIEPIGRPTIEDATPAALTSGEVVTVSTLGITDGDNPGGSLANTPVSFIWQVDRGKGFEDIIAGPAGDLAFASADGSKLLLTEDLVGLSIRVKATYLDAHGVAETVLSLASAPIVAGAPPPPPVTPVPVADAVAGGEGINLVRSDLDFILDQIRISEANAHGAPLQSLLPNVRMPLGLRTVTGEDNNLVYPQFGAADNTFPRATTPQFNPAENVSIDLDGPGPLTLGAPTSYQQTSGFVFDSAPRTISNLIVDQTAANPAAYANAFDVGANGHLDFGVTGPANDDVLKDGVSIVKSPGLDGQFGTTDDRDVFFFENVTPDAGLSAPFNSWMTFFGQFFDHGLDLVTKGGNGTVFIPLKADDPLIAGADGAFGTADDLPASLRFMTLTRATMQPGADGVLGTADDIHENTNTTSPFVDQNQTYSSHPSHQVFLRAYTMGSDGQVHATGGLITNKNLGADGHFGGGDDTEIGGMATWAIVKAQARDLLGINLTDADFDNVPLLATDAYGNFLPGANGYPQVVTKGLDGLSGTADDELVEGNPAAPISLANAVRTGHAFLNDINDNAVPVIVGGVLQADADSDIGNPQPRNAQGQKLTYDNELLDAHYVAGDGRVNENIGLTAVHSLFHSEHNRLMAQVKDTALHSNDVAFLNEWLRVDVTTFPATPAEIAALEWDGERLFQAAKFGTEMQYQHLVFEEFARTIQPNVDLFFAPTQVYDVNLDASIVAEFAHTVYRFGHSMLTETVDRFDADFNVVGDPNSADADQQLGLIAAFLNPLAFAASGDTPEDAVGAIVRGTVRQAGNEIDEFVTEALRNNLLGLPLDLPAINLARGRDVGIPTLNAVRSQIYTATGDSQLKPYTSWTDLVQYLKHPESVINFIAAYGTHESITSATTTAAKRAAATLLVLGGAGEPADRLDFLNSTGAWANDSAVHTTKDLDHVTVTGLGNIDLWIGGLAEEKMPFGGMLGSTFNFIFENQLEKLQDGDRFYYLERTAGLSFNAELESNSFAKLIMANTNATHLPAVVFTTPAFTLEVDQSHQFNGELGSADPTGGVLLTPLVIRDNPDTAGPDSNYIKYTGPDHIVLGGTAGDDIMYSSEGDDTLWGDAGNDRLDGGYGNDQLRGGAGDDIITDLGGDDNFQGGDGNDVLQGGNGINLIIGGFGDDFIVTGEDASEAIAGHGNDFILGTKADEQNMGNEGDDWIEGGTSDGAPGDNFDPLGLDRVIGNDVFLGRGENDKFNAEGGDDIMVGSTGLGDRFIGSSGFDWATFKDNQTGVTVDLSDRFFDQPVVPGGGGGLMRFDWVEGLSGSKQADALYGDNVDAAGIATAGATGSVLTNIALIDGLQDLLNALNPDGPNVTFFDGGNIILGGAGGDQISGRGGNDRMDGDAWLNVRISVRALVDLDNDNVADRDANGLLLQGDEIATFDSMSPMVSHMLAGEWNVGQLRIVREILYSDHPSDFDTALYAGPSGNYTVTIDTRGTADIGDDIVTVTDNVGTDGVDTLTHIERLQFTDGVIELAGDDARPVGLLTILDAATNTPDTSPSEDQLLRVSIAGVTDADNVSTAGAIPEPVAYFWQVETVPGSGVFDDLLVDFAAGEVARVTGPTFRPTDAEIGLSLRVRAVYRDENGTLEEVYSAPTAPVGNVNDAPVGVPLISDTTPTEDIAITASTAGITDADGLTTAVFSFQWQQAATAAGPWTDIAGAAGPSFTPGAAQVLQVLRVVVTYTDDQGTTETVTSAPTGNVGDHIVGTAANNTLNGTAFDDWLEGLGGADNLNGGAGSDLIDGGAANDVLNGNEGDDTLLGGAGADTLNGGAGNDANAGGAGTDTYIIDDVGDTVTENAGEGTDVVQTSLAAYTLTANVENLTFTGAGNFAGTGNAQANTIQGGAGNDTLLGLGNNDNLQGNGGDDTLVGGAGNDTLTGGANNDTLNGGAGNDALNGGGGNDTASYADETDAFFVNLAAGTARRGSAAAAVEDTFASVENVTGGSGGDTLAGDGAANILDGGDGNDIINGAGGADTLLGRNGADVINGGAGNDNIDGGAGNDTITYAIGDGTDTINGGADTDTLTITDGAGASTLTIGFNGALTSINGGAVSNIEIVNVSLGGGTDTLSYAGSAVAITVTLGGAASGLTSVTGVENVTGGNGNDTITGDAGNNNLNGGAGNDTLNGNGGNDTLVGGAGDDTYIVNAAGTVTITEAAGGGTDSVFTNRATFTLANNVENLTFTGAGGFTGNGNGNDNVITGGAGNDSLSGAGGADTLIGGGGIDSLDGGAGNDTLIGGGGNDAMNGQGGDDIFVFGPGFGGDTISGFDANPTGGQDLLNIHDFGFTAANLLSHVTISAGAGNTLITFDTGDSIMLLGVNGAGQNVITTADFIF